MVKEHIYFRVRLIVRVHVFSRTFVLLFYNPLFDCATYIRNVSSIHVLYLYNSSETISDHMDN